MTAWSEGSPGDSPIEGIGLLENSNSGCMKNRISNGDSEDSPEFAMADIQAE